MSEETMETPTKAKKKGGAMMAVVAAVVAASVGGFAGISLLGPSVGEKLAADSHEEQGARPAKKDDGHGGGGAAEPTVHIIDNLVVNPSGSGATRFLLASVAIAPGDHAYVEDLAARDIEMRDALLRLLGGKTVAELADISLRNELTDEMHSILGQLLGEGMVGQIYLPQFVIQ
jgi:flagellar FliL protein